jgi:hypothetical protein
MAAELLCVSEPPRRITALPDFRHRAPASAVTFGRLSKMTPTTPMGVRTRWMRQTVRPLPFGHDLADRIGEFGDRLEARRDRLDTLRTQRAAVDDGRGGSGGLQSGDVERIGLENGAGRRAQSRGGAAQRLVLHGAVGPGDAHTAASRARAPISATRAATSPSGLLATARVLVLLINSGLQARNFIARALPAYCAARAEVNAWHLTPPAAPGRRGGPSRRGRENPGWLRCRPSGGR